MARRGKASKVPFGGYHETRQPAEDVELTHVEPGMPCGELMRRYWMPVALTREVRDIPLRVRLLGEDLVLFRDRSDRYGLFHRHCCHRRAPLEYATLEPRGLRCCYHGWLYDVDGALLEAPAEPSGTKLLATVRQPAYPVREYRGLVFAYLGPPDGRPPFPILDTYEISDTEMIPYALDVPCNWLNITENSIDPVHTVFLHTRAFGTQFFETWGQIPQLAFHERPTGFMFTSTRRVDNHVWVRSQDLLVPNMTQGGSVSTADGKRVRFFGRSGYTRWQVPIDSRHTRVMGWRHFNDIADPPEARFKTPEMIEIQEIGELKDRPLEERLRRPGDYEIFTGLSPMTVGGKEHLATTDRGVTMLRRRLRAAIKEIQDGKRPPRPGEFEQMPIATFGGDTVVLAPALDGGDDDALKRRVADEVTSLYFRSAERPLVERRRIVEDEMRSFDA